MTNAEKRKLEDWDLTAKISPYLDRHMIFPLLEYVDSLIDQGHMKAYDKKDVAAARLDLLAPTHMIDYASDVYKILGQSVPIELQQRKDAVFKELEELKKKCEPLATLCNDEVERNKLKSLRQWTIKHLVHSKGITEEMVDNYHKLARVNFDCGDYKAARDKLSHYISLHANAPTPQQSLDDDDDTMAMDDRNRMDTNSNSDTGNSSMYYLEKADEKMLQVIWGRLACEILVEDWEAASVAVVAVRTALEALVREDKVNALSALQQRTWLLHWSLFVYWNDTKASGLEQLIEMFNAERYKQAIVTNAPHLVRYWTAAVLLCKRRVTASSSKSSSSSNAESRRLLKYLVYVLQDVEYTDPIVEFVNSLTVKFDFEAAQVKLAECESVLKADFFLCRQTELFMEEARVFVFENYCRIHNKIDLQAVSDKLAMNRSDAEKWITDLIRQADDLDAKMEKDCVVMGRSSRNVYSQVAQVRDFNSRASTFTQNFATFLSDARKEKTKRDMAAREE